MLWPKKALKARFETAHVLASLPGACATELMRFERVEVYQYGAAVCNQDVRVFQIAMSDAIIPEFANHIQNPAYYRESLIAADIGIRQEAVELLSVYILGHYIRFPYERPVALLDIGYRFGGGNAQHSQPMSVQPTVPGARSLNCMA